MKGNVGLLARAVLVAFGLVLLSSVCHGGFVEKRGHQLFLDGKPFYFMGANAYWLIDSVLSDRGNIDRFFDHCNDYGIKVIRIWGFNHGMPYAWGKYDDNQFKGLDYIVDSAGRHNIKLVIALGNTWTAYRSPQDWMSMAGINPAGKDLLDFYQSSQVQSLFKDHISTIVWRTNTYNNRRYRDDDAIMLWDVFNEPRCPGCIDDTTQWAPINFLTMMSSHLKANAPNQLVAAGTEGYFLNAYEEYNPGAGARCEGEDWARISRIPTLDVTVEHVYDRQMESVPPTWKRCDFKCFVNYFIQYLSIHQRLSVQVGKPNVLEEFNLKYPEHTEEERALLFQLVYDNLLWQKRTNGSMAGVMFWSAAIGTTWDDGYNLYLDGPLSKPKPSPPSGGSGGSSSSGDSSSGGLSSSGGSTTTPEPSRKPIVENKETLTDFLRGGYRAQCADAAAKWWLPAWTAQWAQTVDMDAYASRTKDTTILQIMLNTKWQLYN